MSSHSSQLTAHSSQLTTHNSQRKPEIPNREVPQLWKYGVDVRLLDSKPSCQCGGVLIDRSRRYPSAASISVVGTTQLKRRKHRVAGPRDTIEIAAKHGSTNN